jgi:flagellar P-ring protein FlgI
MRTRALLRGTVAALAILVVGSGSGWGSSQRSRIGDLTIRQGEIPRRLVGYGLVVGLEGTGDRSFSGVSSENATVRSVVNLLRRFNIEVPSEHLRLRNVAAVLVTAEVSPYLRAGGRFEVQVAAMGDALSLRGGVLWITPLVSDPNEPPVATAQGPLQMANDGFARLSGPRRGNAGLIPQGGILEIDPPDLGPAQPRLLLRKPDLGVAQRVAAVIDKAFGAGTCRVDDPGAVTLTPGGEYAQQVQLFLAAVDTLDVTYSTPSRVVISGRDGTVVAGGDLTIGPATVSHNEITLRIGEASPDGQANSAGVVDLGTQASVQDVTVGLRAAGAQPEEVAAILQALEAAGVLRAEVVIR